MLCFLLVHCECKRKTVSLLCAAELHLCSIDANTDGKICGQCRKAVTDYRKSGQRFLCKYDKFQIVSYSKCNRLKMKHF